MPQYGIDSSSPRALGIDVGSTHVKASVIAVSDKGGAPGIVRELAVAQAAVNGLAASDLIAAALLVTERALREFGESGVGHIGISSMAETGALVDPHGQAVGPLLRWDRAQPRQGTVLLEIDAAHLQAQTGAFLGPKLPLLAWAQLAREELPKGARWGFVADIVAAALTGRLVTDHTLAGRSGAYLLPPPGQAVPTGWDAALLDAGRVPAALPPPVLAPGEPVATIRGGGIQGVAHDATVWIAGHDHAVSAWFAGMHRAGTAVHSFGTTEAVLALGGPTAAVDRRAAGAQGLSVVRSVDGLHEGVIAGNPAAGALIGQWRARTLEAGGDPDALLAAVDATPGDDDDAIVLPYPRGRVCPEPDPLATQRTLGGCDTPLSELRGLVRGIAAHGAWMRGAVADLAGTADTVRVLGTPVRSNQRLASLLAFLADTPVDLVDVRAPAASGAASLALVRAGVIAPPTPPLRAIEPHDDHVPDLIHRLLAATRL